MTDIWNDFAKPLAMAQGKLTGQRYTPGMSAMEMRFITEELPKGKPLEDEEGYKAGDSCPDCRFDSVLTEEDIDYFAQFGDEPMCSHCAYIHLK